MEWSLGRLGPGGGAAVAWYQRTELMCTVVDVSKVET